ncbi:MAG: CHASE2 and HATPase_c domain-containing protein, partial [Pseudomonadales bacterium]|nr:CHASE2 and HATPase_c domain-containing protein [Pseudomonadales bacterium]
DSDGIVRRFYQFEGIGDAFWSHFATVVAELATDYQQPVLVSNTNSGSPLVNVRRLPRLIPFLGGVGSFQQVSFYDVVSGKLPARLFKDRVVFVGATSISLGDLLPTPVTVSGEQMPGVEINATIFDAARNHSFIEQASPIYTSALCALIVLATVFLIPRVAGRTALLFIVATSALLIIAQAILILKLSYWLPLASAIIGQWLVYPLWTVLRLDQTIRYLQKQLFSLREELGHQSLVEQRIDSDQVFLQKLHQMMQLAAIDDYSLSVNNVVLHELKRNANINNQPLDVSSIALGPSRVEDAFYCRYRFHHKDYLVVAPISNTAEWSELKEAYITGFFESELKDSGVFFEGTYDLVFKYLNEVRASQYQVNSARLLFEFCVNEMNDGVIIVDEFGSVLFVNRLAFNYMAIEEPDNEDEQELTLFDLLIKLPLKASQKDWSQLLFDIVSDRSSMEVEVETESGNNLLVNLSYLDLLSHRSNLIVMNLYDITRIREAQRLRNETIDFLSHDMRSPMVSLIAMVNQKRTIKKGVQQKSDQNEIDESDSEFLNQIEHYANKNLYFAEQFLQLARVESGEMIQTYELDFEAVVQNAIDETYNQAQEKDIQLNFTASDDLLWVKGNGELLERAVVNLITNAIKYGPAASTVDIDLKPYGESVLLRVRDYGEGIPKELQSHLFAPYQRAHGQGKVQQKGAGLGLRFVDVTVKRHNGDLFFNSQPGRTEFGFTLPMINIA